MKKPIVTRGIIEKFRDNPEFQRFLMDLSGVSSDTANKVVGGTADNIVILKSDGDIKDSGKSFDDVKLKKSSTRTVTADYQIVISDEIIWVDASGGNIEITMLDPSDIAGQTFIIQKIDATENIVTVSGGAYLINGVASGDLKYQRDYIKPTSNGVEYLI